MKLITYLEQKAKDQVDIANGLYNINIKYTPNGSTDQKSISFTIATDATVPQLSQEIRQKTAEQLTIPATDPSYEGKKRLYDIFLANAPEFNVIYNPKNKGPKYEVRIIQNNTTVKK
jgi:hypothetical protein